MEYINKFHPTRVTVINAMICVLTVNTYQSSTVKGSCSNDEGKPLFDYTITQVAAVSLRRLYQSCTGIKLISGASLLIL